jgi:hypothetical protein
MANIAVDRKTKEQGQICLIPPYSYSILKFLFGVMHKWRQELNNDGLLPEQEILKSNRNISPYQIFSFFVDTVTLSEMTVYLLSITSALC